MSIGLKTYAQGGFISRFYLPNSIDNTARAIFELNPGNYFAAGFVYDTVNGIYKNRLCIMGLNAVGQLQWTKKYDNPQFEYLSNNFLRRTFYRQGNFFYYTGCVRDLNNKYNGVLIKFKLNGDTVWQKIYKDAVEDVIPQMLVGSVDGGFLLTGFFQNWNNHTQPCLLIKTDALGNELWRKRLHKSNCDVSDGRMILQDSTTKRIFIAGHQYLGCGNPYDNLTVTDSLGNNPIFNNYMGDGGFLSDMIRLKDKKILLVGMQFNSQVLSGGYKSLQSYIAKIDANNPGTPLWSKEFDKPTSDNYFSCVRELPNGDLIVGGCIDTLRPINLVPNYYIKLTKFDSVGNLKFNRYYDYKTNDVAKTNYMEMESLELNTDGSLIVAVRVPNSPAPNPFLFVKFDGNGCDSSAAHCATVNYTGLSKINDRHFEGGIKLWPNPAGDFFNLEIYNSLPSGVADRIVITNYLGEELVNEPILNSTHASSVDVQGLNSGCYFVEIYSNGKRIGKQRLILMK